MLRNQGHVHIIFAAGVRTREWDNISMRSSTGIRKTTIAWDDDQWDPGPEPEGLIGEYSLNSTCLHVPELHSACLRRHYNVFSPAGWGDRGLQSPDQNSLGFHRGLSIIGFLTFCPWVCRTVRPQGTRLRPGVVDECDPASYYNE